MMEVRNLTFTYGKKTVNECKVLDDISFEIREGELIGLIGSSGSGKTTLIKHLNGLLKADSGDILFHGQSIYDKKYVLSKLRKEVGLVFQYPEQQLFKNTVLADVSFGPLNMGLSHEDAEKSAKESLELVGIDSDYYYVSPLELSGGQKRCVAIAGVLAMKPKLLIFDEATAMLDPQGKDEIKKVIMDIHQETGLTVLSITHDIDEIAQADYVIALADGQIVSTGSPEEIFFNEEKLKKIQLDVPFSMKLSAELEKLGIHTEKHITMEGLVEELCRYNSKM